MFRCFAALAFLFVASSCSTVVHEPKWRTKQIVDGKEVTRLVSSPPKMQKWNPVWWLGNVDSSEPPADYKPGDPRREAKWRWRNPGHNFTFYVIGIADKEFTRTGMHPEDVFRSGGGWNAALSRWTVVLLPFVSYQGRHVSTYLGWRERGNFGAKLNVRWRGREPENRPAQSRSGGVLP